MKSNLLLFKDIRFVPIFIVQFCSCLNDNIMKNAVIMLITYKLSNNLYNNSYLLVLAANVIFVLSFVIFASLAGQIADRYERSTIVKIIKLFELFIVLFATYGFQKNDLIILFLSIFFMGIHATFFGPIKYSVLPDHLHKVELLGANGLVEAGTFFSILIGTIIGGYYTINSNLILLIMIIIALIGLVSSQFMLKSYNSNPKIKINTNIIYETIELIKYSYSKKQVYLSILGISWFWFISAAIISQIPSLAKETFGADENVANLFLAIFSIGVGIGSFWCNKILKNEITTKYMFLTTIGISLFGIDLFFASKIGKIHYEPEQLKSILVFLSKKHNWRIIVDLFFIAAIGGLYIVPLFAALQYFTSPAHRSRIIAVNNLINSLFMAGSTVILTLLFYLEYSIPFVILFISILNMLVAYCIYKITPEVKIIPFSIIQAVFRFIFDITYRVEIKGKDNFYKAGAKVVVIANHISYIDPPILAAYLPEEMIFAINTNISKAFWVKPFLKLNKTLPITSDNPMAIKTLIKEIQQNKKIAIFPEGRISITGSLMKIYEGPGMIAEKSGAMILPIKVEGTEFTHFAKQRNNLKKRFFPKITITILPAIEIKNIQNLELLTPKEKRQVIGNFLYEIMINSMFYGSNLQQTLFYSLINAAKIYGKNKKILEDSSLEKITYKQLLLNSFRLAELLKRQTLGNNVLGLMMPNTIESITLFFAMQASGYHILVIDYNNNIEDIIIRCKTAKVSIIYSSKKIFNNTEFKKIQNHLLNSGIEIILIEDFKKRITWPIKIKSFLYQKTPFLYYKKLCNNIDNTMPAVLLPDIKNTNILIVLSHKNIQAAHLQISTILQLNPLDIAIVDLAFYESYGLLKIITMLFKGVHTVLNFFENKQNNTPERIYNIAPTIIISIPEILKQYAYQAHPYDFFSVKYVISCKELLQKDVHNIWQNKFGIRIFQEFGLPETTSIISLNTQMNYRSKTSGKFVPGITYFIKSLKKKNTGILLVKGPNIMLGQMFFKNPGVIFSSNTKELGSKSYNTNTKVLIKDGFLTVLH